MTKKPALPAVCVVLLGMCALPVLAQKNVQVISNAVWSDPVQADVSAPLRSYPVQASGAAHVHAPLHPKLGQLKAGSHTPGRGLNAPVGNNQPNVGLNFDGISDDPNASDNCPSASGFLVTPPDTNAAVGDTQIVEWVNLCYSVFDKATGNLVAGPFAGTNFWNGFGGGCQANNDGDPIIQWDKANHVWVASQNDFGPGFNGPFATCIAVSTTADATGSYNRYRFSQPGFPDYHKWGLTPHAYYQTQNIFGPTSFLGVNVCAYQADALRAGSKRAKQVCILDNSNGTLFDDSMLPADSDADPPTAGPPPEVLLGSIDNANPGSNVYEYVFTVTSFKGKGKATLAGVNGSMPMAVPTYTLACGNAGACIPQPSTGSDLLESLGDRLLYRLALFDDGVTQHFLVTHNVNNTTAVAARWYEFTAPTGTTSLSFAQAGETPDDGEFRWMGSIARDSLGNIALGYSRTSANTGDFPSIYVSGQTAGEAPGTTDAEVLVQAGGGSQIDGTSRWGDYSSMALDGADHCTFWYAGEYFAHDSQFFGDWYTHLAQVKFPGCP